ncbi:MAG: histidine kinase dimerization/phospho-acceptor domain-containing protein, partial [Pseudomonadota bacterium]
MRRLTITLLLVVLVAIFGLGIALDTLFERYNTEAQDEFTPIQTLASGWAQVLDQSDNPTAALSHWPQQLSYQASIDTIDTLPLPAPLKPGFEAGNPLALESEVGVSMHYYLPSHRQVLSVTTPLMPESQNRPIAIVFTGLFYAGTLLLVLLWLKPLLSRLNLLRKTTRAFGTGELTSRVPEGGLSYIRDIESDFNSMADRIQQLVNDNKLLSSAVSHDLRTPLARLRFGIETLAETTDNSSREQYHRRISNDLSEMENLVNSLLRYAQLDNVLADIDKHPVSLRSLLHECTTQYYDSNIIIKTDDTAINSDDTLTINGA